MSESDSRKLLILDACVLIDYWKTDRRLLGLFSKHLGPVHVASPILGEVDDIQDPEELAKLGVNIVEPELEDVLSAGIKRRQLSFLDCLCLFVAKREGFTCVTNDKSLRIACEMEGIDVTWGLELLLMLYGHGGITESVALEIAGQIRASNPLYITRNVLNSFSVKLKAMSDLSNRTLL